MSKGARTHERKGTEASLDGLTAGAADAPAPPATFIAAPLPPEMPSWWHDPEPDDKPLPRLVHPAPITDPALRAAVAALRRLHGEQE